jgi:MerR family transcriptional regulator, copper efflux regulator
MDSFRDYFTIKEASKLLGVCQATLRRWDKLGKLKAIRHPINGYRLYNKGAIKGIIRQATGPVNKL